MYHILNFTFTVVNEGALASSPVGNYSLAILQVSEASLPHLDIESLRIMIPSLPHLDIVKEASKLKSVEIGGNEQAIGGHMKFLAILCSIE